MATEPVGVPEWAVGDLPQLVHYLAAHHESVEMLQQLDSALEVWLADVPRYVEHLGFYCNRLLNRYEDDEDVEKLHRCAALCGEANQAGTLDGLTRHRLRIQQIAISVALARRNHGSEAMARELSARCLELRAEVRLLFVPTLLADLTRNSVYWAKKAIADDHWAAAADAYELAARAVDQLFRTVDVGQRMQMLARFAFVAPDAATALVRAERPAEAVTVLEAARQRLTSFHRNVINLENLLRAQNPQLHAKFIDETAALNAESRAWLSESEPAQGQAAQQRLGELAERLTATLAEIHQVPGFERYMLSSSFAEITEAAIECPVLYLWSSRFGTAAILVLGDGSTVGARLDALNNTHLAPAFANWMSALDPVVPTSDAATRMELARLAAILEVAGVQGLLKRVLTRRFVEDPGGPGWRGGPVTLVVSGLLSYFPVHIWTPYIADTDGTPMHHMPLTYAPSARRALAARRPPRPTGATRRLLSIADPRPLTCGLTSLPLTRIESEMIARNALDSVLLHGEHATRQAVLEHTKRPFDVVHLACHGTVDPERPGHSTLELSGGPLTLDDVIATMSLGDASLVLITACHSGRPDPLMPDEALDFGSTFLAADARAVVSAMWPVDDLAASLFSCQLLRIWNWGDGLPLPAAVHAARLWLRDLTVAKLIAIGQTEPALQPAIKCYTRMFSPDTKRFSEPYFWAAFAYSGG